MRSRTLLVGSIVALAAVLAVGGFTRMTSASFTDGLTTGGNSVTRRQALQPLRGHARLFGDRQCRLALDQPGPRHLAPDDHQRLHRPERELHDPDCDAGRPRARPARLRLLRTVRRSERHARPGSLERRVAHDLPFRRRPRHRPDQAQARQLDLALPRLLGHARRGACCSREPHRHGDRGRRHQARLARLQHDDEPRGLRRLPLDGRQLDEAQHVTPHRHDLDRHVQRRTAPSTPIACARSRAGRPRSRASTARPRRRAPTRLHRRAPRPSRSPTAAVRATPTSTSRTARRSPSRSRSRRARSPPTS